MEYLGLIFNPRARDRGVCEGTAGDKNSEFQGEEGNFSYPFYLIQGESVRAVTGNVFII